MNDEQAAAKKLPGQILVTGASSGIGRATCLHLLQSGNEVVGMARFTTQDAIEHDGFSAEPIDMSDLGNLPAGLESIAEKYPEIRYVVCCAGRGQFGSLEEFSFEQIRNLVDTNFVSAAYVARTFLPRLKKHRQGHLVFLGSESALKGERKGAIYCASKFALRGMAQALRDECVRSHVRVTIINPGMVKSPFFDDLSFEPGNEAENYLTPDDVVEAVVYALYSRPQVSIDEINLSPLKHVVQHKHKPR